MAHIYIIHENDEWTAPLRRELDELGRMRPKFYCLNDDQGERPDPWVRERVRQFLEGYYPEPSMFELNGRD